jgi:hypothetical protein
MKKPDLLNMESKEYEKTFDDLLQKYGIIKAWLLVFIFFFIILSAAILNREETITVLKGKIKQDSISIQSYRNLNQINK